MLQPDNNAIKKFFFDILTRNLSDSALLWLQKNIKAISESENEKTLFTSFSMAPRFAGKQKLVLQKEDIIEANNLKAGFNPTHFSTDQAVRILLLLASYKNEIQPFVKRVEKILSVADIQEQIAVYSSLALLPQSEYFAGIAAEGIRTNITDVFDAIVLGNPFPYEYLSEGAWNQMILKAIFTNRPLYKIYGFDKRRNAYLAKMLSDFAHERWAAGRSLTPEIWRATSPFIDGNLIKDIDRLLTSDNPLEQEAGCLVLYENNTENSKEKLSPFHLIISRIVSGHLTWDTLGKKIENLV